MQSVHNIEHSLSGLYAKFPYIFVLYIQSVYIFVCKVNTSMAWEVRHSYLELLPSFVCVASLWPLCGQNQCCMYVDTSRYGQHCRHCCQVGLTPTFPTFYSGQTEYRNLWHRSKQSEYSTLARMRAPNLKFVLLCGSAELLTVVVCRARR